MKRLFLAVDLDDQARQAIGQIAAELRERLPDLGRTTWIHPDRMHLTLHFFGEVDEAAEKWAMAAVDRPVPMDPFHLSFGGFGFFPQRGGPRVLWLGISRGLFDLQRLRGEMEQRLGPAGRPAESFSPHLTLARLRGRPAAGLAAKLGAISGSAGPCPIDRVTLYESRLSQAGPSYTALARAFLKP